jgi:hypothetical protein
MWAKLFITVVVPAPDEPVTAMMGCLRDMVLLQERREPRQIGALRPSYNRTVGRNSERSLNSGDT